MFPILELIVILIYFLPIIPHIALSKKDNRYVGLIFPAIFFVLSFYTTSQSHIVADAPSGEVLRFYLLMFLLSNLITLLYLAIYGACRKRKQNTV